jgi:hypothetical protein
MRRCGTLSPACLTVVFNIVSAKKRTKTSRESALLDVARLDRRGYTTRKIAPLLGVSHVQVAYDLKVLRERYQSLTAEERKAAVAEKRLQYREIREELWQEWERSKNDAERSVKERRAKTGKAPKKGQATVEDAEHLKVVMTTEGRLADANYLGKVLHVHELECRLDGLNAPTKREPTSPDGEAEVGSGLTDAARIAGLRAMVERFERETGRRATTDAAPAAAHDR